MADEVACFVEKCIASWASEAFEEVVDAFDVNGCCIVEVSLFSRIYRYFSELILPRSLHLQYRYRK